MGVYPEPALCADDACRLASGDAIQAEPRHTAAARRSSPSDRGRTSRLLILVALGALLGPGTQAACAHGGGSFGDGIETRSDRQPGRLAAESGGSLLEREAPSLPAVDASAFDPSGLQAKEDEDVLRFGDKSVPRPLVETIVRAAEATKVDPAYMMALADKESSFDTDVKNPASSAQGLFQFLAGTWLELIRTYGAKHGLAAEAEAAGRGGDAATRKRVLGLRNDPYVAGLMAGEAIKRDRARIENRIGRALTTTELYLAHFLGTASAGKFLSLRAQEPETVAARAFRGAAKSNRNLFTERDGKSRRALSVAEVHERIDGMIDRRVSQFEPVKALAAPSAQDALSAEAPLLDARLRVPDPAIPVTQ